MCKPSLAFQVAVGERRSAPVALPKAGQDWSAQYLIFLTSLAKTSSQPLQLLHLQRCAAAPPARCCNTWLMCAVMPVRASR